MTAQVKIAQSLYRITVKETGGATSVFTIEGKGKRGDAPGRHWGTIVGTTFAALPNGATSAIQSSDVRAGDLAVLDFYGPNGQRFPAVCHNPARGAAVWGDLIDLLMPIALVPNLTVFAESRAIDNGAGIVLFDVSAAGKRRNGPTDGTSYPFWNEATPGVVTYQPNTYGLDKGFCARLEHEGIDAPGGAAFTLELRKNGSVHDSISVVAPAAGKRQYLLVSDLQLQTNDTLSMTMTVTGMSSASTIRGLGLTVWPW